MALISSAWRLKWEREKKKEGWVKRTELRNMQVELVTETKKNCQEDAQAITVFDTRIFLRLFELVINQDVWVVI